MPKVGGGCLFKYNPSLYASPINSDIIEFSVSKSEMASSLKKRG